MEPHVSVTPEEIIAATREWIEKAVIGLNLCPFARSVYLQRRIRFSVSEARSEGNLLHDLGAELAYLNSAGKESVETTVILVPHMLHEFADFNAFLDPADHLLNELGLSGEIQIASFHPAYQFAGTEPEDVSNFTNRSPYPTLHLLREESLENAIGSFPQPEQIYEENIRTMKRLGREGWNRLWLKP